MTPDDIARLRMHPAAGAPQTSANGGPDARKRFFNDLNRLLKVGDARLLVPESGLLGGAGFVAVDESGPACYNDDTLKHFEIALALDCAAVLANGSHPAGRRIVCEIGGGWGGFAAYFHALSPDVTYVIIAPPDRLVVSATYLMTAFPTAAVTFELPGAPGDFWNGLTSTDFAFATPEVLRRPMGHKVDLVLDIQALESMPVAEVQAYVRAAYDVGAKYFYSLGPASAPRAGGLTDVASEIEKAFWLYELPVPQYEGMKPLIGFRGAGPADGVDRVHRFGWRRIRP